VQQVKVQEGLHGGGRAAETAGWRGGRAKTGTVGRRGGGGGDCAEEKAAIEEGPKSGEQLQYRLLASAGDWDLSSDWYSSSKLLSESSTSVTTGDVA
jgi:hypothetical protein